MAVTGPGLAVRVESAGSRLWVVSSGLAADPAALAALRDRLTATLPAGAPAAPDPVAADLAAQLAAEQAFREITGLPGSAGGRDASRTVHVVDSRPLGWRSLDLNDVTGEADGPDATALIGRCATDTPADWAQLPVCLARVVPGPGTPEGRAAAGWGATGGEAEAAALRAFLRGPDPRGGAGTTPDAALLDAALRLAAADRQADDRTPWQDGEPEQAPTAGAVPVRRRVHPRAARPGGPVCAEVVLGSPSGETWHGTAWGQDEATALDGARALARARRQLAAHERTLAADLGPDCRIAEELAATAADPRALAAELLGRPVEFRRHVPDPLLGAHPLVHGVLVAGAEAGR
ncbi:hypothetical protein EF918_34135 [Streptomyces sp. WAC06614]|nr:hypothetical protein EF918_34135 [Streptomyces sp. WAC06614]